MSRRKTDERVNKSPLGAKAPGGYFILSIKGAEAAQSPAFGRAGGGQALLARRDFGAHPGTKILRRPRPPFMLNIK